MAMTVATRYGPEFAIFIAISLGARVVWPMLPGLGVLVASSWRPFSFVIAHHGD